MKKVMMTAALTAALASCQSNGNQNNALAPGDGILAIEATDSSAVAVYEGVLPAADGPGIEYVLSVDSIGPQGEGGYTLEMTYLDADGPGRHKTFVTKGTQKKVQKKVNNQTKHALQLTPDDGGSPVYFVVVNDTTLRLVNDSLQESVSQLSYDLIQVQ